MVRRARVTIADANPVQTVTIGAATQYLAAGAAGSWGVSLTATQDGAAAAEVPVVWSTTCDWVYAVTGDGHDRGEWDGGSWWRRWVRLRAGRRMW